MRLNQTENVKVMAKERKINSLTSTGIRMYVNGRLEK